MKKLDYFSTNTTRNIVFSVLCLVAVAVAVAVDAAITVTHPADILALKNLKLAVEPGSIPFGSCLSSWDLSLDGSGPGPGPGPDPCDSLFSAQFTCGLRCDFSLSGLSRVTDISLDSAGYSGSLSSVTWNFPYLHTLDLSGNSFSGEIPESLSSLSRLRRLVLSRNLFSKSIPYSLGSLSYLEELYLDENRFSGSIPRSFNKLTHLKRLEIQSNFFSGDFPYLGSLKNVYFLDASQNSISSLGLSNPLSLPVSLISFSMRNNNLTGEMPRKFFHMEFLEVLDLSYNRLSGSITGEIFLHPSLQQLSLGHNRFSSVQTPSPLEKIGKNLVAVDLGYNEIDGLLPKFFSKFPSLSALSLEYNRFTGMIPSGYAVKVEMSSFHRLLLGGNYLFGPIPAPLKRVKPGSVNLSLVDNCLIACPHRYFFCKGGDQKSLIECKSLRHAFP